MTFINEENLFTEPRGRLEESMSHSLSGMRETVQVNFSTDGPKGSAVAWAFPSHIRYLHRSAELHYTDNRRLSSKNP